MDAVNKCFFIDGGLQSILKINIFISGHYFES
jgi:hypothetical protein